MTFKVIPDLPDFEINEEGEVRDIKKQGLRKPSKCNQYMTVSLNNTNHYVHKLVMLTFVGPRPEGQWIRHLDGDPTNNCLSNLTYGTQKENAGDRSKHGTWGCKLTERHVRIIRGLHKCGFSYRRLTELFSVDRTTIFRIVRRRSWQHVG